MDKKSAPILKYLPEIKKMGYKFYFEFTLTPYGCDIEPNIPDKNILIDTFKKLCDLEGRKCIDWRYDPVFIDSHHPISYHEEKFSLLCEKLSKYTERCIISFIDCYKHIKNKFRPMTLQEIYTVSEIFSQTASKYNLPLFTCCENTDLQKYGILPSACIDKNKIEKITGYSIKTKKDISQRKNCLCIESIDIGAYNTCLHKCSYCYANSGKHIFPPNPISPALGEYQANAAIREKHPASLRDIEIKFNFTD